MKAPKIGYQDGGKTKKPLDYSKSKLVEKTEDQLLKEGYKKDIKDGKAYFYKEKESNTPKTPKPPTPDKVRTISAPKIGTSTPKKPHPKPGVPAKPIDDYSQEIVHLKTPIMETPAVNSDVSARQEEKRDALGTGMYQISYPDLKGGGGMSKATTEIFNNDPSKGAIGAHISGFDNSGNPIFSGKTQNDFKARDIGGVGLMSNDVNKNSVETQLANSKNPVETTGNKSQEMAIQGLNAPAIDKADQGINTGLMDITKLPSVELTKKRDASVPVTSPTFKLGGKVKAPSIKKYAGSGSIDLSDEEKGQGYYIQNGIKYNQQGMPQLTPNVNDSNTYDPNKPISANTQLQTGGTEVQTTANNPTAKTDTQPKQKGSTAGLAGKLAGSMGWYQYANQAQKGVRQWNDTTNTQTITDPITGETVKKYNNLQGSATEAIAKPLHEKVLGDVKSGNTGKAAARLAIMSDPILGNAAMMGYDILDNQRQENKYNQAEYNIKKQEQAQKAEADRIEASRKRDAGEIMTVSKYEQPVIAKPEEKKYFLDEIGLANGGKVEGAGTAKSDSITAKVKEGSFVVPAENADKAEAIRKAVLKKAPNIKANLKQGGGVDVKLSNGEHLFTPDEIKELKAAGIDVDALAPHAKSATHFADGGLTPDKARQILHDGTIRGHKLTEQQRKYFGFISNKK